ARPFQPGSTTPPDRWCYRPPRQRPGSRRLTCSITSSTVIPCDHPAGPGALLVAAGHVGGLLIPESRTAAAGISETASHAVAAGLGTIAGFLTVAGAAILIYRRRTVGPVFSATTRNDKAMY